MFFPHKNRTAERTQASNIPGVLKADTIICKVDAAWGVTPCVMRAISTGAVDWFSLVYNCIERVAKAFEISCSTKDKSGSKKKLTQMDPVRGTQS